MSATLSRILGQLKEALETATMEKSSFSRLHVSWVKEEERNWVDYPTCEKEVDAFIKYRTRLWRSSWLEGPVARAITEIRERIELGENIRPKIPATPSPLEDTVPELAKLSSKVLHYFGDIVEKLTEAGCQVNLRAWQNNGEALDLNQLTGEFELGILKVETILE